MTINANDTSSTPVTPAPAGPTPPLNSYEQLVVKLNNDIDALVAQIPEFQVPHPTTTKFVRSHQNVPQEFWTSAAAAVSDSPALQAANAFDADEARDAQQFVDAFQPLLEKVTLFGKNLKFTLMNRKANVSVKAQTVYGVAKQLDRDPNSKLSGHVQILRGHLPRRKSKSPAPTPGTVTTPVTPAPVVHLTAPQEGGVLTQKAA
jgi:hypothetical protein